MKRLDDQEQADTNLSLLVDVARHNADLTLARLDDTRAVRTLRSRHTIPQRMSNGHRRRETHKEYVVGRPEHAGTCRKE